MAHAVQGKTFERRYKNFRSQLQSSTVHFTQKRGRSASRRAKCNAHICLMYKADAVETLLKILQKMMWIKKLSAMTCCCATIIAALRDSWKASIPILTDYRQTFLFV